MGRTYAGLLGPVAFGVIVAQSVLGGESAESTLIAASLALFTFAAIGYVIGSIADRTIVEAIESRFHEQLKAEEKVTADIMEGTNLASGVEQPA